MANYPPPPNHRLAYDLDGTRVFRWQSTGSAGSELTVAQMRTLNDEAYEPEVTWGGSSKTDGLIFLFPEPRTITHVYGSNGATYATSLSVYGSADSTNGIDGTWQGMGTLSPSSVSSLVESRYRSDVYTCSPPRSVRALQVRSTSYDGQGFRAVHLYGTPASPSYGLAFRNASTDTALSAAFWDWEDSMSGTLATKQFRIKNFSADYTANDVSTGLSILTDSTPGVLGSFQFSLDGATWSSSVSLGDLEPGDLSAVITLRRDLPSDSSLGLRAPRVRAAAVSWEVV